MGSIAKFLSDHPLESIGTIIAALGLLYAALPYHRSARRDNRDDLLKALTLVKAIEITLAEKARKAQKGHDGSGVTTKEAEDMERTLQEAFVVAPSSAEIHKIAASYYEAVGKLALSEKHYKDAVSLAPKDPSMQLAYFIHLYRRKDSRAEDHLQSALRLAQESPAVFTDIGMILSVMERLEDAESAYRRGLSIDPNNSATWFNLGSVLRKRGKLEESCAALAKAAEINPNDPEIFCNLGTACARMGKHGEALAHLRNAIRLDPTYALPHQNMAAVLSSVGLHAEAQQSHELYKRLLSHQTK